MQNCIFFFKSLVTNILRNSRLVSKFADSINKIPISPEFSTPKFYFHLRILFEYLFGRDAFQHCDDLGRTHLGNRLNQKMNMVIVRTNLHKMNLIPFLNFHANFFQCFINCFAKHNPPIFGWTNKMIQQY